MKRLLPALLFTATLCAADLQVIPVWPGTAPGSENCTWSEEQNMSVRDKSLNVRNVISPTLTVYPADPAAATGTAIVICPGGGFRNLGFGKEGEEVARWLNSIGVTAFVLKYRLAQTGDDDANDPTKLGARVTAIIPLAVADAQQAMRLVRSRAAEWNLDPHRIGIMGFSAGGFLTTSVALHHDAGNRPNFAAPIYGGAPATIEVPADAPPLFLVHAEDDPFSRPVNHTTRVFSAWSQAGVPVELHAYARGGHGFGLRRQGLPVDTWNERLRDWLGSLGLLTPPSPPPAPDSGQAAPE